MADYLDLLEKDFQRQIEFNNIKKYHDLGYKGKGITILNAEMLSDHGKMTTKVINNYAPEATVINSTISGSTSGDKVNDTFLTIDGKRIDFEEAIDKYNIKIVTKSFSGSINTARINYFKDIQKRKGVIFFCSAGNDGSDGVTGMYTKDDTAIAVGSAVIKDNGVVERKYYSAMGEELDFMSFMARGVGTSAASPALASQTSLLLQRYGDFNQEQCVEILKSLCIDLGEKGRDIRFGWGLPILPLTDKLPVLEDYKTPTIPEQPTPINKYHKVQIGAFSIKANAQNLVSKLKLAGFNTYMPAIDSDGLYRVQCGAFVEKENAIKLQNQLINKGFSGAFIVYK